VTVVSVDATTRAAIEAGGNITGGVITSPEVALEAAGSIANVDLDSGAVTLAALAGGSVELDAGGSLTVGLVDGVDQGLSGVIAGGNVTLDAGKSLAVNADITAGGSFADLSALSGDITTVAGAVVTAGSVNVDATGAIDLNTNAGTLEASFGAGSTATIDEADALMIRNTTGGTLNVTLLEAGDLTDGGGNNVTNLIAETQDGNITYTDADDLNVVSVIAGGSSNTVFLTAGSAMAVTYIQAEGDVTLRSNGAITDVGGAAVNVYSGGTLDIQSGDNTVDLDTEVVSLIAANVSDINIDEVDAIEILGIDTNAGGNVDVETTDGDILVSGPIDADAAGTILLTAGGTERAIILGANVAGNSGSIMLHATDDVEQTGGAVTTGVGVEVTAGGEVDLTQAGNAMTVIAVDANGDVAIDDDAAGGLTVGTVNGVSGIDSNNNDIRVNSAGDLTL
ncbi:beta strand repeat-containing protein, partial [Desulfatibacillum aliphaticivorans]|uniref:beta strand repeat-containing protein n=1 Tax=Desulfatibacillum aliphaticivorans TaxID=218208 RepID=UPI00055466E2